MTISVRTFYADTRHCTFVARTMTPARLRLYCAAYDILIRARYSRYCIIVVSPTDNNGYVGVHTYRAVCVADLIKFYVSNTRRAIIHNTIFEWRERRGGGVKNSSRKRYARTADAQAHLLMCRKHLYKKRPV